MADQFGRGSDLDGPYKQPKIKRRMDKAQQDYIRNEHGAQTLAHEDVPQPGHESTKLQANPGQDDKFNRPFNPSEKLNTMIQGE